MECSMNKVQEFVYDLLPKIKNRGEWKCFNCPSCCRFGEGRPDSKQRGGLKFDGDGLVYHCFNCHFSWGWMPNFRISKKMNMFLEDLGLNNSQLMELRKLVDEFIDKPSEGKKQTIQRIIRDIPNEYKSIIKSLQDGENSKTLNKVYSYLQGRNERLLMWTDLMWAEGRDNFLIPCYEFGKIVGYSLRQLNDESEHKYIHYVPSGYIFNFDNMNKNRKYQILVEGQTDALSLDCLSLLSNTFTNDKLKRILDYKGESEIIIVADRDEAGKKLVNQVINEKLPFSVSFPNWDFGIKDVEEAVKKYGRLYTLYNILQNKESDINKIKIKLGSWVR